MTEIYGLTRSEPRSMADPDSRNLRISFILDDAFWRSDVSIVLNPDDGMPSGQDLENRCRFLRSVESSVLLMRIGSVPTGNRSLRGAIFGWLRRVLAHVKEKWQFWLVGINLSVSSIWKPVCQIYFHSSCDNGEPWREGSAGFCDWRLAGVLPKGVNGAVGNRCTNTISLTGRIRGRLWGAKLSSRFLVLNRERGDPGQLTLKWLTARPGVDRKSLQSMWAFLSFPVSHTEE